MKTITLILTTLMLVACTAQEKQEPTKTKELNKTVQVVKPKERSGEELFEKACNYCHNYRIAIRNHAVPNLKLETLVEYMKRYKNGQHNTECMSHLVEEDLVDVIPKEMEKIAKFIHKLNSGEVKMKPLPPQPIREVRKKVHKVTERKLQPLDKSTQEYKAFKKQKNRFVLNPCGMSYNEKPIRFGMSVEEIYEVLGKESLFTHRYYWEKKGIKCLFIKNELASITIYLKKMTKNSYIGYEIKGNSSIEILNSILNQNEKIHNFLDETNFHFDDFSKFDIGYELHYLCNNKSYEYHFISKVPYERIGYGHLTMSGDFLSHETYAVDSVTIFLNEEEN